MCMKGGVSVCVVYVLLLLVLPDPPHPLDTHAFAQALLEHQLSLHLRHLEPFSQAFRACDTSGTGCLTRAQFIDLFTHRLRHEHYAIVPPLLMEHAYGRYVYVCVSLYKLL